MIQHHLKETPSTIEVMFNNENIALTKRDSAVPSAPCKCWTLLRSFFDFPGAIEWALDCGPQMIQVGQPFRSPSFPLCSVSTLALLVRRVWHFHVLPPEEISFRDPEPELGPEGPARSVAVACFLPKLFKGVFPFRQFQTVNKGGIHALIKK